MAQPGQMSFGESGAVHKAAQGQREESSAEETPETAVVLGQPKSINALEIPGEVKMEGRPDSDSQNPENAEKSVTPAAGVGGQGDEHVPGMQDQGSGGKLKDGTREKTPAMAPVPLVTSGDGISDAALNSTSAQVQQGQEEMKTPPPAEPTGGNEGTPPGPGSGETTQHSGMQTKEEGTESKSDPELLQKKMLIELQNL